MKNIRRAMALMAITLVGLGAAAPAAHAAAAPDPIFECSAPNSDGTYTAFFGYTNPGNEVVLPIGGQNQFTTPPKGRGQPTTFQPGRHVAVFAVRFDPSEHPKWHLGNSTAEANITQLCSAPAELSETNSLLALPLASLGSIALWFGIQRRRNGAAGPPAPGVA